MQNFRVIMCFMICHSPLPDRGGEQSRQIGIPYLLRVVSISIPVVLPEGPSILIYYWELWALPRKFSFGRFLIMDLVISVYWAAPMCLGLCRWAAYEVWTVLCYVCLWSPCSALTDLLSLGHFYFVVSWFQLSWADSAQSVQADGW